MKKLFPLALAAALLCGCHAQEPPPAPPPPEPEPAPVVTGPAVVVDWSKLEQKAPLTPDVDGGRWHSGPANRLLPREDYGPLYPYVGTTVSPRSEWEDEHGETQVWVYETDSPVYGLMTRDGKIVTDPVYQAVYRPEHRYAGQNTPLPVLLSIQTDPAPPSEGTVSPNYLTVSAVDGRWCIDFTYWAYTHNHSDLLFLGPEGLTRVDTHTGGTENWSWEELGIQADSLPLLVDEARWVYGFQWLPQGVFLGFVDPETGGEPDRNGDYFGTSLRRIFDPYTGGITMMTREEWDTVQSAYYENSGGDLNEGWRCTRDEETVTITNDIDTYTFPIPHGLEALHDASVNGELAILMDYQSRAKYWVYHLPTGTCLLESDGYTTFLQDDADLTAPAYVWVNAPEHGVALYSPDFVKVAEFPPDSNCSADIQAGLLSVHGYGDFFSVLDLVSGETVFHRDLDCLSPRDTLVMENGWP